MALALGIDVNAAILSAVNGFVLRPLPMAGVMQAEDNLAIAYMGPEVAARNFCLTISATSADTVLAVTRKASGASDTIFS